MRRSLLYIEHYADGLPLATACRRNSSNLGSLSNVRRQSCNFALGFSEARHDIAFRLRRYDDLFRLTITQTTIPQYYRWKRMFGLK